MPTKLKYRMGSLYYLSVSEPVSGLQFDVTTAGSMTKVGDQYMDYASLGGNEYRVLMFVLTNTTFSGQIVQSNSPFSGVENVIASDIDGNRIVGVTVS